MLKIAICDDEDIICSQIETIILNSSNYSSNVEILIFNCGRKLFEYLKSNDCFDIIFLDIEMDNLDGITTGNIIRNELHNHLTNIIFISWKDTYCKQLFEIRPTNFLQKPLSEKQIIRELDYARNLQNKNSQTFSFRVGQELFKIPFSNIITFESRNKVVIIDTGKNEYRFYDTLDNVFSIVKSHGFIRIHKSCIVNYLHITRFKYDEVELTNSKKLTISQSKRKEARAIQLLLEEENN